MKKKKQRKTNKRPNKNFQINEKEKKERKTDKVCERKETSERWFRVKNVE